MQGKQREWAGGREIRRIDGWYNNLGHVEMGGAGEQLRRLTFADYGDGMMAMAGPERRSARHISNIMHHEGDPPVVNPFGTTNFLWAWGQFIDHDISLTEALPASDTNAEPAPISVPLGDPYFDPQGTGTQTIAFTRAGFDPATGTSPANPRQHDNDITAWIDASQVYGSSEERLAALRVGPDSPFLRTSEGDLLPFNDMGLPNGNGTGADPASLFLAGDVRANEQVTLAALHVLFVREHNRMAQAMIDQDPAADSEVVFQNARRLVAALMQAVTYNEFLPALLGNNPLPPYSGYRANTDASIAHEFSAAAFRFGHSSIPSEIVRLDEAGMASRGGPVALRGAFFTAPRLFRERDDIDSLLRGLAARPHRRIDVMINEDLRNFLFGAPGAGGFDLAAINIQRGRDQGVPSYNEVRERLGFGRAVSFADITSDTDVQQRLASAYRSVEDVDLWVGGLAEDAAGEGQLGPLFRELIIRQFTSLRDGDRFWYERTLTFGELAEVRNTKLSDIIRRNTGVGPLLRDDVFRM